MIMEKIVKKILGAITPVVKFINKYINMPFSKKRISGDHYYVWRKIIKKGYIFLTNTSGAGTNIINVSKINHGAIYFGAGLRTSILKIIKSTDDLELKKRLTDVLYKYRVDDEICYVIESVGEGVKPTNLVTFMTTKDMLICNAPNFCSESIMSKASDESLNDLGMGYDYKFSENDNRRYCFELVGRAYEITTDIKLKRKTYKFLRFKIYSALMSNSLNDSNWDNIIDSSNYKI